MAVNRTPGELMRRPRMATKTNSMTLIAARAARAAEIVTNETTKQPFDSGRDEGE